ncbi:MAG: hypothetical protein U0703_08700 [Anaerolineae bacterium]
MATRRVGSGARRLPRAVFTVRDAEFGTFVERWIAEGLVFEWSRGWC